jgi:hypothetical protein
MVVARWCRRRYLSPEISRTVNDLLVDIADHHLQIEIVQGLPPKGLQLIEILA